MLLTTFKDLLKPKGFSLLEMAATMGLMGVVSLFTIKVMEQQSMSQQSIEASAEINTTISTIAQTINDPVKCNSMFYNKAIGEALPGLSYTVMRDGVSAGTHRLLETLADHNKVYKDFYIKDDSSIVLGSDPRTGTASLDITFHVQALAKSQKMKLFDNANAKTIKRSIPFKVVLNPSNRIISCGPVVSSNEYLAKKNACSALKGVGGYWNTSLDRCVIAAGSCPFGRLFKGFTADASGNLTINCEPAINHVKAEDIFDLGYAANCVGKTQWQLEVVSNKLRIRCF